MKITFTPGLYFGNNIIDGQHLKMFEMADNIIQSVEKGMGKQELIKLTDELADYVLVHIADEEKYMKAESYPKAYEHKKIHESFIENTEKLLDRFADTQDEEEHNFLVIEFVVDYVLEHIKNHDLKFVEYMNVTNKMDNML